MYRFGTDDIYCEVTNACCSGMIDINTGLWSEKILKVFEIDINKLPDLVNPGTVVGKISAEASMHSGFAEGTKICTGSGDQQCAALGAGVVKDGFASLTLGTAGLLVVGKKKIFIDRIQGLMVPMAATKGLYELEGIQLSAADSYKWIRNILGGVEKVLGAELGISSYRLLECI